MPTDTERRLEALENLALYGAGIVTGTASGRQLVTAGAKAAGRGIPRIAARAAGTAYMVARRHPAGALITTSALVGYIAYKEGVSLETAQDLAQDLVVQELEFQRSSPTRFLEEGLKGAIHERITGGRKPGRRKVSRANKAVQKAMSILKAGTKASTGADKGKLAKGSFRVAVKAAGLANPNTPSRVGKGVSKVKNLARKLKKWWK
jgi:hypothetical protein